MKKYQYLGVLLLYDAPEIILKIPDIAQIYDYNEIQEKELDAAVEELNDDIMLNTMHLRTIERWEKILNINPLDDDTEEDRRFKVKAKVNEKLPYSLRVLKRKLDTLCPSGYSMELADDRTNVLIKIALTSKKMRNTVAEMLEEMLPLNMMYSTQIMYNTWEMLESYTWGELENRTWEQLRSEVLK